jgi:translation initiation factor IF-3
MNLDLVVVSPRANPPVCKLMDYSRFKFENAKKAKAALRQSHRVVVKEVRLRPTTDERDLLLKAETVRRLLLDRYKVRLVVTLRGREAIHPETGRDALERIAQNVGDVGAVEESPMLDGRRLVALLRPL